MLLILHFIRFRSVIVHAEAFTVPRDKDRFERDAILGQNISQFLVRVGDDGETLTDVVVFIVVFVVYVVVVVVFCVIVLFKAIARKTTI